MPKFFHKFCSFWSFGVYGPSSSMVDDYTAERRKTEREKRKMFSPGPTTQREEKFCMRNFNNINFSLCVCVCVFVFVCL